MAFWLVLYLTNSIKVFIINYMYNNMVYITKTLKLNDCTKFDRFAEQGWCVRSLSDDCTSVTIAKLFTRDEAFLYKLEN
jgi:hypothetical protein